MSRTPQSFGLLSRRDMMRRGAWGLTLGALWPPKLLLADASYSLTRLLLRYRTDPERISRALPPPLQADEEAEVWVEYALATLPDSAEATLVVPASYGWSGIFVAARHGDQRGLFPAGLWVSDEWSRISAREFLGLNVKHAEVSLEIQGEKILGNVRRHEQVLHRFETAASGEASADSAEPAQDRRVVFTYLYRLSPNWAGEPLAGKPVDLAYVGAGMSPDASDVSGPAAVSSLLACAPGQTVFQWEHASPLDPAIEFPVEEILAVGFEKAAAPGSLIVNPRSQTPPRSRVQVATADFEPWAMLNYDRPVTNEQPWRPPGWRASATAYRLGEDELTAYRERPELRLESVNLVDIQLVAEREAFQEAMPPQFQPGLRLRLLALRVGASDLTAAPFNEVWLLAYGLLENRPLWLALSHVVGPGGDLTFGRETFGYPSKLGEVDVVTTPIDFSVLGRRKGREFCYTEGTFQGFSTGTSLAQIDVACLRAGPFHGNDPRGEIVLQHWYFQGQRSHVDRQSLVTEFPDEEAPGGLGRPDPWSEFNPFRVVSVTVMQHGGMQRMPAEIAAEAGGIAPFYLERCDGVLAGKDPLADFAAPSFRVKPAVNTRSVSPLRSI